MLHVAYLLRADSSGRTPVGFVHWDGRRPATDAWRSQQHRADGVIEPLRARVVFYDWYRLKYPEQCIHCVATPQPLGGLRWWLLCPQCSTRRRALYIWGDYWLRCRVCCRLTYATQRMTARDCARRRALRLAKKVIVWADVADRFPPRRAGQWRKKYDRLQRAWRTTRLQFAAHTAAPPSPSRSADEAKAS